MNSNKIIQINRIADVDNGKLVFIQEVVKGGIEKRTLIFDPNRCSGCCICVYSCPVNAIQFAGYEMLMAGMPLIIDHTNCVFCGICYALCPDRAFEFEVEENKKVYFKLKGKAVKLENCVNCMICPTVCPAEAVNYKTLVKVDDLHDRFAETKECKGKLEIDLEKCKLCGICTAFCDALVAIESYELTKPFSEILLREDRCDFCGLCEYVCPNQAIKVESTNKIEVDAEKINVIEVEFNQKCIECGICELSCPYEGVKVEKSFEGEIEVFWNRLDKFCDVESCKACINVCKSKAWSLTEGKLKLNAELCRFCRACANVCPEKLIEVKLDKINVDVLSEELPGGWLKAIERVLEESTVETFSKFAKFEVGEKLEKEVKVESDDRKVEKTKKAEKSELKKKLNSLREILRKPGYRRLLETKPEKFLKSVKTDF